MQFSSLRTTAFRNLADKEIFTGVKDIFLVGENGQGKTNFLEALYFCAYASSFRTRRDSEIARSSSGSLQGGVFLKTGEKDFCAEVKLTWSVNDAILVKHESGKKLIFINGKRTEDRKELLSIAPTIVFCHEDMEFVNGSHDRRRWFFDQTLSLYDPVYLEDLHRYRRVLKSRNTLLRDIALRKCSDNPEPVLDALDSQLALYGLKLMEKRQSAVHEFSSLFSLLYKEVSGICGITVNYIQSWKTEDPAAHLQQKRHADMAVGLSLSGPHRDRYEFSHNGTDFTVKASTGQKRLLALLLRAAQACRYSTMTNQHPVLLLDDVLLEMDSEKRHRFISVLPSYDQAFYTFLPDEPYERYRKDDTLVYNVIEGMIQT